VGVSAVCPGLDSVSTTQFPEYNCEITAIDPIPLGTILTGCEAEVVSGNIFNIHVLVLGKRGEFQSGQQ
jgi:hypothetical protein